MWNHGQQYNDSFVIFRKQSYNPMASVWNRFEAWAVLIVRGPVMQWSIAMHWDHYKCGQNGERRFHSDGIELKPTNKQTTAIFISEYMKALKAVLFKGNKITKISVTNQLIKINYSKLTIVIDFGYIGYKQVMLIGGWWSILKYPPQPKIFENTPSFFKILGENFRKPGKSEKVRLI